MEYTTNYNLILQGRKPERVSLDSLNGNFTKIDTLLKEQSENHNNHTSDTTTHVTAADKDKWNKNTTDIATVEEQSILNRQTLGYERKNLLNNTASTVTKSGITFTINDDKSITVSGTATANADLEIVMDAPAVGDNVLTGCPSGGGTDAYWLRAYYTVEGSTSYNIIDTDTGNGCNVKITATMARFIARIRIYSGQTVDNLIFKPMLRDARISDATYVPYKASVEERLKDAEERLATAETVISIIALKTNTDLNTCITAGHYASTGTTVGNTITNRPTGVIMFNLEILTCGNYITQIIYPITASYVGRIYIRRGWDNGASWGDWYEFSGVAMTTTTEV